MSKPKLALLIFGATWIGCLCLFDYYRDDICSQKENMDYEMSENLGESDSSEVTNLSS